MTKTVFEGELNKEVGIFHTPTAYWLLQRSFDAFALYMFYCYTVSWQTTNQVKATREFVKTALGWGNTRYATAKKILEQADIVSQIKKRSPGGKLSGVYVSVRYINTPTTRLTHHMSQPEHVATETPNALIKKINANVINTNAYEHSHTEEQPYTESKLAVTNSVSTAPVTPPDVEALVECISAINRVCGTHHKPSLSLLPNFKFWFRDYTLEEMVRAYYNCSLDPWWKDKLTPTKFFRRKDTSGGEVNRIEEFLSSKHQEAIK